MIGLWTMAAVSCTALPSDVGEPSFLRASVEGAVVESYEGTATFHVGTPGPGRQQFQVSSYAGQQSGPSFAVTRWDGGRLGLGSYPLGLADLDGHLNGRGEPPQGITLQFFHTGEQFESQFIAYDGVLEITHSSSDRVEGRFEFRGERYCLRERIRSNPPVEPVGPCSPPSSRLGAPEIRVSGTFLAIPLRIDAGGVRR